VDFSRLFERYAPDVHRFALYLSGNRALTDDLAAEAFVRALVGRDSLRVETLKAYLLAIVRNLYRDVCRREGRLVSLEQAPVEAGARTCPEAGSDGRLRLDEVLAAMQLLPQGEREALVLAADGDLPYAEVAAILGCSVPAVKVRVHRARARLKAILGEGVRK
jgi:RNA polymerase sigma-70 factor (ECF subfamily)